MTEVGCQRPGNGSRQGCESFVLCHPLSVRPRLTRGGRSRGSQAFHAQCCPFATGGRTTDDRQVGPNAYPSCAVRRASLPFALVLSRLIRNSMLCRTRLPMHLIGLAVGEPTRSFLKPPPDGFQNFSRRQFGHGEVLSIISQRAASCTVRGTPGMRSAMSTRPSSELS